MNNLLRTISGGPSKVNFPEADLKLLLSSVRDVRSQDTKAADSFYCSLEGVLLELRNVSADNRDAEAFLKPVSRTEYPDYYELIKHPMDLGTMLKNVKNRKYKSKQEFAADLNLIWKNCFKYNSGPEHVLRGCVTRLKRKADHLLAHVSDRPDRVTINGLPTPSAPHSSSSSRETPNNAAKINGIVNGIALQEHMPTPDPSTPQANMTPTPAPSNSHSQSKSPHSVRGSPPKPSTSTGIPFEDQPALIRTPANMSLFVDLDRELQRTLDGVPEEVGMLPMLGFDTKGKGKETLLQRLKNLVDDPMDVDEDGSTPLGADVAADRLKRKRSFSVQDQRKRPRLSDSLATESEDDLLQTWWDAARSSSLLVGGLPSLPQLDVAEYRMDKEHQRPSKLTSRRKPRDPRKSGKRKNVSTLSRPPNPNKSLLKLMNKNISTLSRVRHTHAKFVALNAASDPNNPAPPLPEPASEQELDAHVVDEAGWRVRGEVGQEAADDCLGWMGSKVLQHAGFQGTSQTALGVLTSVAGEYLQNVGRTIRFMCDKYSNTMTPEEIILHTLFESGTTEIQDLERYVKDDVVRYGTRLGELEKKLVGAYREVTSVEVPSDERMFEDGEDADHFASGGLADILGGGEDFLGLRELGIEAEFGLKSLSIPKRLWKGKSGVEDRAAADRANAGEPPPPFPPPPPFIPLAASKVDSQIGLLKQFYQERLATLAASSSSSASMDTGTVPAVPPNPMPSTIASSLYTLPSSTMSSTQTTLSLVLPDDPPNPTRAKIGPLGQVIVTNPSNAAGKKKGKAKEVVADKSKDKDPEAANLKKKGPKKKGKGDPQLGATNIDGQVIEPDLNGTGPKKKPKGGGKKSTKNSKPTLEVPPALVASA